ncbi:MAG: hypothetical protein AMK69_14295 [Nitrospira bacterium SG8_3]|nr:MAG: hypothetical protein AMK69_14295 [Nitrospira bacterium SG8_3]
MKFSDIQARKSWQRKAINFIILDHHRSLLNICYHWLFQGSTPPASTKIINKNNKLSVGGNQIVPILVAFFICHISIRP